MRVGVFQFETCGNIKSNYEKMTEAISHAAQEKIRLLVFSECALCGYPPIERDSVDDIDFKQIDSCIEEFKRQAKSYDMYLAVGTVRRDVACYNSIIVIGPDGNLLGTYDKRALWGWDTGNFTRGSADGIYQIDDLKVGFRICFEIRFPEFFRELFKAEVPLCFVSFCDVAEMDLKQRHALIQAHLMTRAVENVMTVISVNSISGCQTAPTAVFDENGCMIEAAPENIEHLLVYDFTQPIPGFSAKGRKINSEILMNKNSH